MRIAIADRNSDLEALTGIFSDNLTTSYISHSELQGRRAIRPGEWTGDIKAVLRREIAERLREPMDAFPSIDFWQGVIEAREDGAIVGIAFVTLSRKANVPFGVVEDIVIDARLRDHGRGEAMMTWMIDTFRRAGIDRVFLESGITNDSAHHLFERLGFKTVSIVMMRDA
ncbi:MAG TPA: GNAT family N-acetyltransferase [Xanthobacteraceae bacterium]|nr:GNAT family N-acetyltransferase [Xanthobacteraceae bacterium]